MPRGETAAAKQLAPLCHNRGKGRDLRDLGFEGLDLCSFTKIRQKMTEV